MAGSKHGVEGNKNAEKFKTPAERQEAFRLFCDHMAAGYSAKSFHKPCVENTIYKMIKDHPEEFDHDALLMAKAEGCFVWESMGKLGTMGKLKGFNAASWWRTMQNKLGWQDKIGHGGDAENPTPIAALMVTTAASQATLDRWEKNVILRHEEAKKEGKPKK